MICMFLVCNCYCDRSQYNSVAFWNLISFFVEVIAKSFISLSTWTCNLLGFVARLLLLGLHVGFFVDLKITPFDALFRRSTLLLMIVTNFVVVKFLAIREMNLLFKLFWCSSWGIILGPPPPPPVLLIPFNKYYFVEPCVLSLICVVVLVVSS